ncbi:MAG TPA: DUF1361 domain-containing protein [Candidatus Saccharimonadales bacterium]|nr:DUF1361 domain-containing protein [Candidatus Saccharimonadales bacterium]
MDVFWNNFSWMAVNIFLAILPLIFLNLALKVKNNLVKVVCFLLWFLFFPNTVYLLTDLQYLPGQLSRFDPKLDLLLIGQYLVLILVGVTTYIYSLKPLVSLLMKRYKKIGRIKWNFLVMAFNFAVSFGVFLGKIERTQSWDVFINPLRVLTQINNIIHDPNTFVFIFLFGVLINVIYFARETS